MSWNKEQINVLIDAYKKEPALYAVKHPNYYNKHLRNEALQRITNEVQKVRPNTQIKDCMNKIHQLRNGFNTENKKRKESMKSGSGTDDVSILLIANLLICITLKLMHIKGCVKYKVFKYNSII